MNTKHKASNGLPRLGAFFLLTAALLVGTAFWGGASVEANHPVLVEGNCDSPTPGTTTVPAGTCGDFDGDGLIGTAEDTDGPDRIFGTLNAALGPGTGAAAGTGINHNGSITIVKSGRFAETLYIGQNLTGPGGPGVASPGNVTIAAAPGVSADINAVKDGDTPANNTARQNAAGIQVTYTTTGANTVVTLRNLTIRNFETGILVNNNSRVNVVNCHLENNLNHGIRVSNNARAVISETHVLATGFRIGGNAPAAGNGITADGAGQVRVLHSVSAQNLAAGLANNTGVLANVQVFKFSAHFNAVDVSGNVPGGPPHVTVAPDHNFSSN